ncbi:RhoGEF domain-containing protein, partial [Novilysobacter selenitireducens]
MELVSTEDGYVKDLKILVRIYLAQLSSVESLVEADRQDIARNAAALLELHKKLARRFNAIVDDEKLRELGPGTVSKIAQQKLDSAIDRVAS